MALMRPEPFYGVGASYEDFSQMSDAEVIDLLERARSLPHPTSQAWLKQAAKNEICPLIKALTQIPQADSIRLFLCGDVMTGRGIDQVLPHPNDPRLHEPYIGEARSYVELAERVNGAIPWPVEFDYIWGDALAELDRAGVDLRIINLETSVTSSEDYWRDKEIHYRCIRATSIASPRRTSTAAASRTTMS